MWTKPDITAVSVRTFQHLPGKYVDVWTFEVKPVEALDVTAVFEAASHASRATRSYAPRLETTPEALDEFIGHLSDLAKKRIAQWK
jgi:hypothetical protein